jgi:hypothetical protein
MYRKLLLVTVCLTPLYAAPGHTEDLIWDIGKNPAVSLPKEPGQYRLIATGRVATANYQAEVTLESLPIPPFAQPGTVVGAAPAPAPMPFATQCAAYEKELARLATDATNKYQAPDLKKPNAEEEFSDALGKLRVQVQSPQAGCLPDPAAVQLLKQLDDSTRWEIGTFTMVRGQVLTVKMSRQRDADHQQKFSYEIKTGKRGTWFATYGFGITPNNDDRYYSKAGDNDTFAITKKHDNGGLNPTAAVFYTWLPSRRENADVNYGLAGGIGVDQSNLALFLGLHVTFNQNLGVIGGIALHQETRLRGEYENGQSVTENLTSDALEEKILKPCWFIGLAMRFGAAEK